MSEPDPLVDLDDYETRHGPVAEADQAKIGQLLEDAASLVRATARQTISRQLGDTITLDGDGSHRLFLPELPVIEVHSVVVGGETLTADEYRWWEHGRLDRRGRPWPCEPRSVVVTYDHGYEIVPDWIVALLCSMVQRAVQPWATTGIRAEQLGDHVVTYNATGVAAGTTLWLTDDELRQLRMPVLG